MLRKQWPQEENKPASEYFLYYVKVAQGEICQVFRLFFSGSEVSAPSHISESLRARDLEAFFLPCWGATSGLISTSSLNNLWPDF